MLTTARKAFLFCAVLCCSFPGARAVLERLVRAKSLGPFFWQLFAKDYIGGVARADVLRIAEGLSARGIAPIINYVGENRIDSPDTEKVLEEYRGIFLAAHEAREYREKTGHPGTRSKLEGLRVSVKLSQLGLRQEPSGKVAPESIIQAKENLRKLLRWASAPHEHFAKRGGRFRVPVEIDAEHACMKWAQEVIFWECVDSFPGVRLAEQVRLPETASELYRISRHHNARVRLVKGVYEEGLLDRPKILDAYLECAVYLFYHGLLPAFGTHDRRAIAFIESLARRHPITPFEFQMLYNFKPRLQEALRRRGRAVAVYVAYGPDWQEFVARRLQEFLKNPRETHDILFG